LQTSFAHGFGIELRGITAFTYRRRLIVPTVISRKNPVLVLRVVDIEATFIGMTFESIILKWPGTAAFAREVGVTTDLASKWRRGRGIPSEHWPAVLAAAKERGIRLSADDLIAAQSAARKRRAMA
jgi:hypothetical protein